MTAVHGAGDAALLSSNSRALYTRQCECRSTRRRLQLMWISARPAQLLPARGRASHVTYSAAPAAPPIPSNSKSALMQFFGKKSRQKSDESEIQDLPRDWKRQFPHIGERLQLVKYYRKLQQINALEGRISQLSEKELMDKTQYFKRQLEIGVPAEELLPEAFAVVREVSWRVLGMRHFDVQLVGGMALFEGKIAEMKTGEGKTLVATLAAYLWAVSGRGVHIVTVNDYLAARDAASMGKVFVSLGLTVGVVPLDGSPQVTIDEFRKDVTYVTGQALAFAYLRDNCGNNRSVDMLALHRPLHAVIIDEVDSVLIDDCQNPLLINDSVPTPRWQRRKWRYTLAHQVAAQLRGPTDNWLRTVLETRLCQAGSAARPAWTTEDLAKHLLRVVKEKDATQSEDQVQQVASTRDDSFSWAVTNRARLHDAVQKLREDEVLACSEGIEAEVARLGDRIRSLRDLSDLCYKCVEAHDCVVALEHLPSCMALYEQLIVQEGGNLLGVRVADALDLRASCLHAIASESEDDVAACIQAGLSPEEAAASAGYTLRRPERLEGKGIGFLVRTNEVHFQLDHKTRNAQLTPSGSALAASILRNELWRQEESRQLSNQAEAATVAGDPLAASYYAAAQELLAATSATKEAAPARFQATKEHLWGFDQPWGMYVALAVRIQHLFTREVDYLVQGGEIVIIDKNTGRVRPNSRWNTGIHQACEAKEGLEVRPDSRVQASTTFQAFFRYYDHLCGMTGTAATEAEEFADTYQLQVQRVPTNMPTCRKDHAPLMFPSPLIKMEWLIRKVTGCQKEQQPVLIGTADVDVSEAISAALKAKGVAHQVLNAKPEQLRVESQIIAEAGIPGCVTIATNMAGRGTDIALGGNPKGLVLRLMEHFLLPCLTPGMEELPIPPFPGIRNPIELKKVLPEEVTRALLAAIALLDPTAVVQQCGREEAIKKVGDLVEDAEVVHARVSSVTPSGRLFKERAKAAESVYDDWKGSVYSPRQDQGLTGVSGASPSPGARKLDGADVVMVKLAVMLWLWLDDQCKYMSQEAMRSGGLLVISAFLPHLNRIELQLKGRAGRQGNPGESIVVVDMQDRSFQGVGKHLIQVLTDTRARLTGDARGLPEEMKAARERNGVSDVFVSDLIRMLQTNNVAIDRSMRDLTRDRDQVVEPLRAQTYSLRQRLVASVPHDVSRLIHSYIMMECDDLLERYLDPSVAPAHWPLCRQPIKSPHYEATLERLLSEEADAAAAYSAAAAADCTAATKEASIQGGVAEVDTPAAAAEEAAREALVAAEDAVEAHRATGDPQPGALTVAFGEIVNPPADVDLGEQSMPKVQLDVSRLPTSQRKAALAAFERQQMALTPHLQVLWLDGATPTQQPAAVVLAALCEGRPLPPPPDPAALGHPSPPLEWAVTLSAFRHMRTAMKRPPLRGRHSRQAEELREWMGEALLAAYIAKSQIATNQAANGCDMPHRISVNHVWSYHEVDSLIDQLDELWKEFLRLVAALQEVATVRSFSRRDPMGEFKLEVRSSYAQLLVDFRKYSLQKLFRGMACSPPGPFGKG